MSNYSALKTDINNNIYENNTQQITGTVLNTVLKDMVNTLGAGYQFAGCAYLDLNPGAPDAKVFYLAGEGLYTNFDNIQVPAGKLGILKWDTRWHLETIEGLGGGGANLTGYISVASTDDLPDVGQPTIGYLCGTNLYLYVGEGGDTKDGKYQNCGGFRGPEGVGITEIEQVEQSTENGGRNTIRIHLSDGHSYDVYTRNGTTSTGLFPTIEALQAAYPSPVVGQYAFVGAGFPADIYVCNTAGTWTDSGADYDGDSVDLTNYATKAEVSELQQKATDLEDAVGLIEHKVTDLDGQLGDTLYKDFSINYGWTAGLIDSSGTATDYPYSAYRYSSLIPVTPGDTIKIRVFSPNGSSKAFAFYAQDESVVDVSETGYSKGGTSVISVIIPNTAYFVRLQTNTGDLSVDLAGIYKDPYLTNRTTLAKLGESDGHLMYGAERIYEKDEVDNQFDEVDIDIELLEPKVIDGAIVAYTYWQFLSNNDHFVIPVKEGDLFEASGDGGMIRLCFLKTYSKPVDGATPDYCDGYVGRQSYSLPLSINLPDDCRYLIINQPTAINISSLKINGVEVLGGVHRSISEIGGKIKGVLLKDSDLTVATVSNNIADPLGIIDGALVNVDGSIVSSESWSMYKLPVSPGDIVTFAGFYLGRTGYYAFYNDSTLVSVHGFVDPNGIETPVTVTVPAGANLLYFDIKSGDSPSDPYELLQINRGDELLPYDEYQEVVTKILGKDLISNGTPGTIPDILADLPLSADGTGIETGYAYINSSTGAVIVKQ